MDIINVLKILTEGENYFISIPNYQKIGNEVRDNFNLFKRKEIIVPTPFKLIGHEERLNISIEQKIYGEVTLNPRQAKKVNLPNVIQGSMEYKRKTIIKDGQLNSEKLELIIDMKTYIKLKKNNLNIEDMENNTTYPGKHIILNLNNLEISNKIDYTLNEILNNINKINELKSKQKVLNHLLKDTENEVKEFIGYTEEQTELLKDHGLNKNLQYIGIDNIIEKTIETYNSDVIEFKVKGSTLHSFENVLKRVQEGKKLNELDNIQYEYYNQLKDDINIMNMINKEDIKEYYNSELKSIKSQLNYLKLRNTFIKIEYINSPLKDVAVDENNYKGLQINIKTKSFTK